MVGGENYFISEFGKTSEDFDCAAVSEPGFGDRAVCGIAVGQLADHFRLRACVREHVDEVEHNHVQRHILVGIDETQQFVGRSGVI